jgi:hypothetical protein
MSKLQKTDGLLTVNQAANRAGVPQRKVLLLVWNELIFSRTDAERGYLLSPSVVEELPRLCREHFSPSTGEFLANGPVIADFKARSVSGVTTEHYRGVL